MRIPVNAWCRKGDREYYVLDEAGWIVERQDGEGKCKPVMRIPGRDVVYGRAYAGMEMKGEEIWLYPDNAEGIFIYHIGSGRMRKVFEGNRDAGKHAESRGDVVGKCAEGLDVDAAGKCAGGFGSGEPIMADVDDECISFIRAEKFKRGNTSHVWHENDKNTLDDFFRFLQTAEDCELTGPPAGYSTWLDNLDGSCGRKVLQAVKESVRRN